jgi:hypothetical protein
VTAPRTRIVRHPDQVKFAKESVAYGLLNFGYAVERVTKRNAVVRGGNRSFAPDGPRRRHAPAVVPRRRRL